jgi:LSD1 subclass zinc finger protein
MSSTAILCHQCAAPLPVEQGSQFVTCEFCGTTNFVDKSGAVQHYAVRETVAEPDAAAALRRWMGGNQTVKDLDQKAQIESTSFQLFPMWLLRVQQNGQEKLYLEPAAATSITELTEMTIPASDLEPYDHALDEAAVDPTVPYDTVKKWLAENEKVTADHIKEASLVHLPIYVFKYGFEGRSYTAVVDAATSKVFANIFPSKWETPYFAIGAVGCALYFCAAFIPLAGYFMYDVASFGIGIFIYFAVAVLLAVPIFGAALYISAKV